MQCTYFYNKNTENKYNNDIMTEIQHKIFTSQEQTFGQLSILGNSSSNKPINTTESIQNIFGPKITDIERSAESVGKKINLSQPLYQIQESEEVKLTLASLKNKEGRQVEGITDVNSVNSLDLRSDSFEARSSEEEKI